MPMCLSGGSGKGCRDAQDLGPGLGVIAKQMRKPHVIANRHTDLAKLGLRKFGGVAGTECFAFAVTFAIGQIDVKHVDLVIGRDDLAIRTNHETPVRNAVLIDRPVNDGLIVIWKRVSLAEVKLADQHLPRIGEDPKTWKKRIKKNLKSLEIGLQYTYEFLQNNFGINEKNNLQLIPNRSALLPLVNLFSQTNGQLPKQQTELLKLWTFLAFHHSQYVGKAYGKYLDQDIRAINPKNTLETIKAWLESIKEWVSDTQVYNIGKGLNDKSRFTVFFALKLNNATDWWTGTSIENIPKIEYHHIFPRAVLKKAGYTRMEINDPRNIAVISEYTNRKQKHREPEDYFNDRSLITDPERLFSQFVPREDKQLWKVKNYKKFLEERGKLITEKLNKFVSEQEAKI